MIEKLFDLQASGTTVRREIVAGCTTFMTLSYIIFVQPAILSVTGMDSGAVMTATCISSALAMILMAFLANYPFALAPAMGHNVYFAFTVCGLASMGGFGYSWQQALGAVFIAGVLFILLSFVGLRQTVMNILPVSLRNAIPVGIGLLIALVGLEWAGIVKASPATYVTLGDLKSAPALLSFIWPWSDRCSAGTEHQWCHSDWYSGINCHRFTNWHDKISGSSQCSSIRGTNFSETSTEYFC